MAQGNLKIEILYDAGCPKVELMRERLQIALNQLHLRITWTEWERAQPGTPAYAIHSGSPTLFLNSIDPFPGTPTEGAACRLYGREGAPTTDEISKALAPYLA